jgi:hypothetical protein
VSEPLQASPSEPVTPDEVRALRERLGHTVDHFAATMGVGPGEVRGWEAGTLRIPRTEGAWMRRMLASEARARAAAEAGITDCAWIVARQDALEAGKRTARTVQQLREDVDRHTRDCPDCLRVRDWLQTQPPLPPPPGASGVRGWIAGFVEWTRTLPAPLRPPVCGAALGAVLMVVRAALLLLVKVRTSVVLGGLPLALAVGMALGALGGATWMLAHRPLRRLGKAAPYVTGVVVAVVCILAFLVSGMLRGDTQLSGDWLIHFLVAVVGGLLLGHAFLRHLDDGKTTRPG